MSVLKTQDQKYVKLSHVEHVYKLPDTYVGSSDLTTLNTFIVKEDDSVEKKEIEYVPALYKIYDEVIVNSVDQYVRTKGTKEPVTQINVSIDTSTNSISILNNGKGIDIVKIPEYDMYPPELIFGVLLTSSNYDETEKKTVGGRNGIGSKVANIFSKKFMVETVDSKLKLKFSQTFSNNMRDKTTPVIETYKEQPFTKITFFPDLERFGLKEMSNDMVALMKKRVFDVAAWTDDSVTVTYNGSVVDCANFKEYANLFLGSEEIRPRVFKRFNANWQVIATYNTSEDFEQISFVNGINTIRGGKHVDYISNQICKMIAEFISKKRKLNIKPVYVKNQLMLFVKATIVNPSFDGQTKETLTTSQSKFGSTCVIDQKFIQELLKTGIEDRIVQHAEYKNNKSFKKTDGKKTMSVRGIPKLCDANKAGGRYAKKCTLILTEGDSAKTMAIAGLSEVGRDYYGVFPLRGKLLNVKDADMSQIVKNQEICYIKKILGLKSGETYNDTDDKPWPLRYGKLIIMTDQDVDGSHIKGLVMNVFHSHWRSLLQMNFITSLLTPIVKVIKLRKKVAFYTLTDYEHWKKKNNNGKGWRVKYYKGLGTSTTKEAKEYFKDMKLVTYNWDNINSDNAIDLAFNKSRADDRKSWLNGYNQNVILDSNDADVTYDDFIHKDFIHFSNYNLIRSIPSIMDGLKPSQRKILFCCFKRNLVKEIKVAQLAGYVSENAAYHHGETSLQDTIIGLAQDFVGSNNMNLLMPNGTFGSRLQGGKDAASSRYIYSCMNPLTSLLYKKDDSPILNFLDDDGLSIEPEYYAPIIPSLLINGAKGIGTGYSTTVPMFNPLDVANNLKLRIHQKDMLPIKPWFRDFKGTVVSLDNGNYMTKGKYTMINANTIRITELPIGTWTDKYKEFLESILVDSKTTKKKCILKSYVDHSTDADVDFILKFDYKDVLRLRKEAVVKGVDGIEKALKLTSTKATNFNNIHLYNPDGRIQKYKGSHDIIEDFYKVRRKLYVERRAYHLDLLQKDMQLISERVRFILEIIEGSIDLRNKKNAVVESMLHEKKYPKLGTSKNYDYLIRLPLQSLTQEKVDDLKKERDQKQSELEALQNTSVEMMWLAEIEEFVTAYKKNEAKRKKSRKPAKKKKTVTKKK